MKVKKKLSFTRKSIKKTFYSLFIFLGTLCIIKPYELPSDKIHSKNEKEGFCMVNEDCEYLNYCLLNECQHKRYFFPTEREIVGSLAIFFSSIISNVGGVPGGGIVSPVMSFFLNFNTHEAVAISKLIIFSGSLTAAILFRNTKSPFNSNKSAVDFNLVILLTPLLLFGTTLGVILNQVLPAFIIYMVLSVIIGINFYKTYNLCIFLYNKELESKIKKNTEKTKKGYFARRKLSDDKKDNSTGSTTWDEQKSYLDDSENNTAQTKDDEEEVDEYKEYSVVNKLLISYELEKDRRRFPFYKIIFCLIAFVILLMITLLKGSKNVHSIVNIENCKSLYWMLEFSFFPITVALTLNVSKLIKEEYEYRKQIGYKFTKNDITWNDQTLFKYAFIGLNTGLLAGMLGIGSGLILVPMLLSTGLNPIIASSTTLIVILFESFSVMFQYILLGKMNFDYGITCALISAIGSYLGTTNIQRYINNTGKQSTIVFIATVCMSITFFIYTFNFAINYTDIVNGNKMFIFSSPC